MAISLEAFDAPLRGQYTQWVVQPDICTLPRGFQDQILSGTPQFATHILLHTKTDSRAWHLCTTWELTFCPETNTDWGLLLSICGHLRKPILIVSTPSCKVPDAFWAKLLSGPQPTPTCCALVPLGSQGAVVPTTIPHTVFFPSLQDLTEEDFVKAAHGVPALLRTPVQHLDLRNLYRELRGAGASLCLSQMDARHSFGSSVHFSAMWFYPETNGALRLHLSDLRSILKTLTERLVDA
jgi:hypothetical protein